jgi:hypothetical protein
MVVADQERSSTPRITVCLPTYNRAGYLSQCLGSILAQTFSDFEVVVSDNCSSDATSEIIGALRDPRVRYVRNPSNIGVFPNMNQCLEQARGEYICVVHDDDLYEPRFLECEVEMLDRHPSAAFVHCATYEIDEESRRRRVVRAYPQNRLLAGKAEFVRYLGGHNVCCSTVMVRGDLYRKIGGFDTSLLCSDWLMWLRLCLEGDVAYVAEPQASLRIHKSALSSGIDAARWCREFLAVVQRGLSIAETACPSVLTNRAKMVKRAATSQGRRFFISAVAAMCEGDDSVADGFVDVLRELEQHGLSRAYAGLALACRNPVGRRCLSGVRRLRRMLAAQALPVRAGS